VAIAIGAVVLLLAAPALALKDRPFSIGQLPKDDPAREDAELIERIGWRRPGSTLCDGRCLTGKADYRRRHAQCPGPLARRLAHTPGVQSVIGPSQLTKAVKPLQKGLSACLPPTTKLVRWPTWNRLGTNVERVASGVGVLRNGLSQFTAGAALLAQGSGQARRGLNPTRRGAWARPYQVRRKPPTAIHQIATGSKELAKGNERAALGALQLKFATHDLIPNFNANGLPRAKRLARSLGKLSKETVPQIQVNAQAGSEGVNEALATGGRDDRRQDRPQLSGDPRSAPPAARRDRGGPG